MSSDGNRRNQTIDDAKREAFRGALVPVIASAQWSRIPDQQFVRADSNFVTHLIATAEYAPQTRSLRRAEPSDAKTAYTTVRTPTTSGTQMRRSV